MCILIAVLEEMLLGIIAKIHVILLIIITLILTGP